MTENDNYAMGPDPSLLFQAPNTSNAKMPQLDDTSIPVVQASIPTEAFMLKQSHKMSDAKNTDQSIDTSNAVAYGTAMSTEACMQDARRLANLVQEAQALAASLTTAAPAVLDDSLDYSGTALLQARNSIRSAVSKFSAFIDKVDECCEIKRFTLFPKLPPELRLKIWNEAISGSRVLPVWPIEYRIRRNLDIGNYNGRSIISKNIMHHSPPAILQACQESRNEALKKYTWTADTIHHKSYHRADPANDIIFLVTTERIGKMLTLVECFTEGVMHLIKHLALDTQFLRYGMLPNTLIKHFPNLKTITLVMKCPHHSTYIHDVPEGRNLPTDFSLVCWEHPKQINLGGFSAIAKHTYDQVGHDMNMLRQAYTDQVTKHEKEGISWDAPLLKFCPGIDGFECQECKYGSDLIESDSSDTDESDSSWSLSSGSDDSD